LRFLGVAIIKSFFLMTVVVLVAAAYISYYSTIAPERQKAHEKLVLAMPMK
jgi:hypothetical protein